MLRLVLWRRLLCAALVSTTTAAVPAKPTPTLTTPDTSLATLPVAYFGGNGGRHSSLSFCPGRSIQRTMAIDVICLLSVPPLVTLCTKNAYAHVVVRHNRRKKQRKH